MAYFPNEITFGDNCAIDAFKHLRVSTPTAIARTAFRYDAAPIRWQTILEGTSPSVTHNPNIAAVTMSVGTNADDHCTRQSYQYVRHLAGRSTHIMLTFLFDAPVANVTKRVGYYDDNNGIYYQQEGDGTISLNFRTKVTGSAYDERYEQAAWNKDTMLGTGSSGITIDFTKMQVMWIDFSGRAGKIRAGFVIDGICYPVHQLGTANNRGRPLFTTVNLPGRFEIFNTAASAGASMVQGSSWALAESGQVEEEGIHFSKGNGIAAVSVTTRRPVMSITPKTTFNSITNRGAIIPRSIDISTAGANIYWELVYSGTLTGDSFASVHGWSISQWDASGSALSGGLVIASGYLSTGIGNIRSNLEENIVSRIPLVLNKGGTAGPNLTVVATAFTGTATVSAAINWTEIYN